MSMVNIPYNMVYTSILTSCQPWAHMNKLKSRNTVHIEGIIRPERGGG